MVENMDLSRKDGEELIKAPLATKKTKQTRKRLSYDPRFINLVARLVAAGHEASDIAFFIGVKNGTIAQWKQRYPAFRKAFDQGKKVAGSHLIERGLKQCEGYEVQETTIKYVKPFDCDGHPIEGGEWIESEKKVVTKNVAPNASLLQFFLAKLVPNIFGEEAKPAELKRTTHVSEVADGIQKLAGKLTEMAGGLHEPVEAEFEEVDDTEETEDIES